MPKTIEAGVRTRGSGVLTPGPDPRCAEGVVALRGERGHRSSESEAISATAATTVDRTGQLSHTGFPAVPAVGKIPRQRDQKWSGDQHTDDELSCAARPAPGTKTAGCPARNLHARSGCRHQGRFGGGPSRSVSQPCSPLALLATTGWMLWQHRRAALEQQHAAEVRRRARININSGDRLRHGPGQRATCAGRLHQQVPGQLRRHRRRFRQSAPGRRWSPGRRSTMPP